MKIWKQIHEILAANPFHSSHPFMKYIFGILIWSPLCGPNVYRGLHWLGDRGGLSIISISDSKVIVKLIHNVIAKL